jgi:hypothetical protein
MRLKPLKYSIAWRLYDEMLQRLQVMVEAVEGLDVGMQKQGLISA